MLKQIEIEYVLGSYSFSTNYCGKIISWGTRKVNGKDLIQQSKDSISKPWSVGQKILIADGSDAPGNNKGWKMSCEKQGIVFYDTRIKGALKINL